MSEATIEALENQIANSRDRIELGKAIERLHSNPDFKRVVLQEYLEQEALRLVYIRTDPALQDEQQQADINRQTDGIACLRDFFRTQLQLAELAKGSIDEAEDLREQLLAEEIEA